MIRASAPGKVIIAGEYAVLDGAPAICMAVSRRARVEISAGGEDCHVLAAPGFLSEAVRVTALADCAEIPLLAAVWRTLPVGVAGYLNINIDSREFVATDSKKVGLGSSAAVAVALSAATGQLTGECSNILERAWQAHHAFQGGSGSGADIACSATGGVVEYRRGNRQIAALTWPPGLHYALLWSGQSSDTLLQIKKLAETSLHASRRALAEAASSVVSVWQEGNATDIVAILGSYTATLHQFDVDHALGIFDAGHAELVAAADSSDVVYKPCGAGGGDLGIVISENESALQAFVEVAQGQNFEPLALSMDSSGVQVEGNLG